MVLQLAEHRDRQALQAKLDELLRVNYDARSDLIALDQREPEDIERHRERALRRAGERRNHKSCPP